MRSISQLRKSASARLQWHPSSTLPSWHQAHLRPAWKGALCSFGASNSRMPYPAGSRVLNQVLHQYEAGVLDRTTLLEEHEQIVLQMDAEAPGAQLTSTAPLENTLPHHPWSKTQYFYLDVLHGTAQTRSSSRSLVSRTQVMICHVK
jgi:hypothetical protein